MAPILLIEDDPGIREALVLLLEDEGYQTQEAATLEEAYDLIDHGTFDLILTDLLAHSQETPLASALNLQERAAPTPVAILSAWQAITSAPEAARFAFVMSKPFELDALLTAIAAALHTGRVLSPEDEQRAQVVRQYFAALSHRDWDTLVSLCTDDVVYVLPGASPLSATVVGKPAFRAHSEAVFAHFPGARFDPVNIYATPGGIAARYQSRWLGADQRERQQAGATIFQFSGLLIQQIGVRLESDQLRSLLESS
jgi:CheY-like chemotaxis protein